ncbi:unnamed protein product [Effrenium voratum]|nr:unnamed protein product [Effrenium voratum]
MSHRKAVPWAVALDGHEQSIVTWNRGICRQRWPQACEMLRAMSMRRVVADAITYNSVIHNCDWPKALDLLWKMWHPRPTAISYNSAVDTLPGLWRRAWRLLKHCDLAGCNSALNRLESPQWREGLGLLAGLGSAALRRSAISFNSAARVCAKDMWQLSLLLGRSPRDLVSCNSSLTACEANAQWPLALQLLQRARSDRLQVDLVTQATSIGALRESQRWNWALQLLAAPAPDGISCNSAIRTSPWPVARLLLLGLRPRALQLDAQSFNAAMAEDESWARALELLSAARVSPSAVSYNTAISSCAQAKASSAALRLLSQMSKFFRLDAFSFSSALSACSWHTALDLVGRMASLLVPCNAVTRLALVAACAGRWREAAGVAAREGPAWSGAVGVTEKCGQVCGSWTLPLTWGGNTRRRH